MGPTFFESLTRGGLNVSLGCVFGRPSNTHHFQHCVGFLPPPPQQLAARDENRSLSRLLDRDGGEGPQTVRELQVSTFQSRQ